MLRALCSARGGLRQAARGLACTSGWGSAPSLPLPDSKHMQTAAMATDERTMSPKWAEGGVAAATPTPAGLAAHEAAAASNELRFDALSPGEFSAVADIFLGHLWTRLERGLREAEGEDFDWEVRPERGAMHVLLPYDGRIRIRKDAEARALVVESNLWEPYEDRDRVEFRPVSALEWMDEDGDSLPAFVADALHKYLKADVRI